MVQPAVSASETMIASEPLPHFVDDLLGYLHETHPTHATLDGVHTHDDLLEDVSRQAIDTEAHALAGYLRRLDEINHDALTAARAPRAPHADGAICRRACSSSRPCARGRRIPQFYSDLLASSLAGQALFSHAPAPERARRVLSKLRQTPRLIQAARDNIKDPPGIFVKVGIETMRGALKFIDDELPRAFADVDDLHLLGDLADAQTEAVAGGRRRTSSTSRTKSRRRRAPRSGSGATSSSRSSGSKRGSSMPVDRLLAIATRELKATQEAFKTLAGRMNGGDPLEALGADEGGASRRPASSSHGGREQLDELATFLERQSIITLPPGEADHRRADARFLSLVVCQHVDAGAVRNQADARLLLPDRRRSVVAAGAPGRAPARLQLPDALVDLDSRGLPGTLPALPASAHGRIEGAQVDHVRAGVVRRRVGALLRADDDRGRVRPAGSRHQARTARRIADPPRPLHRLHQAARRGHVGRAGRAVLPRRSVHGGSERAARGRARHLRSDLSGLQRRQADAAQAAPGLQAAAGQGVFAADRSTTRCSARAPRPSGCIVS